MAQSDNLDMCNGAILPKMLLFALPLMASSVMQLLFNAADIAVVGKFGSEHSLAAVGSTVTLINLLTNFFIGLTVGTNVLASVSIGANDDEKLRRIVHTSVALSFLSGLFSAFAGLIFSEKILILMQTPDVVLPLSLQYTRIYFIGMLPTAVYNFGASLLYAKGDTKRPLVFLAIAGTVNVVLNLIFVIGLSLDVSGVALATVVSQTVAAALVLTRLTKQKDALRLYFKEIRLDKEIAIRILRLGIPAGFQGVVFSLSNMVIQSAVNSFGPVVMAGSAASANIEGFVWVCMNAFQQTVTTFISRNVGAGAFGRIDPIRRRALGCAACTGIVLGGLSVLFGHVLLGLYTSSPETIAAGYVRLRIVSGTYFICGVMDTAAGALRGLGASLTPAVVSLVGACGLRLLWIWTGFQLPEYHTVALLFASYPASWILTLAAHLVCYVFIRRKFPKESIKKEA